MKTPIRLFLLSLFCLAPVLVQAQFTVNLDAGELTGPASASVQMQADDTFPSVSGSLLLLVDLGSDNAVSNSLTPGSFVSGNDLVLAAGGFNNNGGTNETLTAFNVTGTSPTGDEIALRWFPQITYADYTLGAKPTAGEYFGTYNPSGGNPDGGDTWTVPSAGSLIGLDFYTTNTDGGGTQDPSEGVASYQVEGTSAVPEPSTYALMGLGLLLMFFVARRRGQSQAS
jgi:hypothetical protein